MIKMTLGQALLLARWTVKMVLRTRANLDIVSITQIMIQMWQVCLYVCLLISICYVTFTVSLLLLAWVHPCQWQFSAGLISCVLYLNMGNTKLGILLAPHSLSPHFLKSLSCFCLDSPEALFVPLSCYWLWRWMQIYVDCHSCRSFVLSLPLLNTLARLYNQAFMLSAL